MTLVKASLLLVLGLSVVVAVPYNYLLHLIPSHLPLSIESRFSVEVIDLFGPAIGLTTLPIILYELPDHTNITSELVYRGEFEEGLYVFAFTPTHTGSYHVCACPTWNCTEMQHCVQVLVCARSSTANGRV
jgi:hypothetical protein